MVARRARKLRVSTGWKARITWSRTATSCISVLTCSCLLQAAQLFFRQPSGAAEGALVVALAQVADRHLVLSAAGVDEVTVAKVNADMARPRLVGAEEHQ